MNTERKSLDRIRVVLAAENKGNKRLSEQLDKAPAIISRWGADAHNSCGDADANIQSFAFQLNTERIKSLFS